MDSRFATPVSSTCTAPSRRWRSLLAGLISLALVLSFFHGLGFDSDDAVPALSIAQLAGDATDKAPIHPAPLHGDHCLTHVSTVATQDTSVTIEYAPHAYRLLAVRAPDTAEPISPFKPPRA
ncbi:hypothetical protein I6F35_09985 [Bradyrhizobium sp. BRP22]|uniref:hypothetical protein n=1 Tax=Bradyrhizobium sp. BRP22 TaxID=2793821 RepID=UPI001CD3F838|nr:hypothetical protein [Bradyrhizobium sp. BRP22]MCA1453543.1 hypothetical protein [Bradyrhizobium sp. BRP22]